MSTHHRPAGYRRHDDWQQRAACSDQVTVFDPTFEGLHRSCATTLAQQICQHCSVRRACLADALRTEAAAGHRWGVRSGLLPGERTRLERRSA